MKCNNILLMLTCCLLAACNPEGSSQPAPPPPPAAAPTPAPAHAPAVELPTEPSPATPAVAVPGAMTACDPAAEATVKWNFDNLPAPPKLVDVYVGTNEADLKLFVTGPSRSDAKTGSWVRPGTLFVLRNHDGGTELSRITVQGPHCG